MPETRNYHQLFFNIININMGFKFEFQSILKNSKHRNVLPAKRIVIDNAFLTMYIVYGMVWNF